LSELALVPRESSEIELGTLRANTPAALLAAASSVATPLAEMIDKQGLANNIQGRQYVRCEGWTTMGAMLGVVPQEVSNVASQDGVYVATVELVNIKTGNVVGRASAECGAPDELDRNGQPIWSNRPAYARRSMAATRATSKAFRLSFSWVMVMAGYSATPAEEVPEGGFDARPVSENSAVRAAAASVAADDPVVGFGLGKGKTVSQQDNHNLLWLIKALDENVKDSAKHRFKASNQRLLDACLREKQRRAVNAQPEEPPPFDDSEPPF
jgi:hypothetical protein